MSRILLTVMLASLGSHLALAQGVERTAGLPTGADFSQLQALNAQVQALKSQNVFLQQALQAQGAQLAQVQQLLNVSRTTVSATAVSGTVTVSNGVSVGSGDNPAWTNGTSTTITLLPTCRPGQLLRMGTNSIACIDFMALLPSCSIGQAYTLGANNTITCTSLYTPPPIVSDGWGIPSNAAP